MKFRVQEMQSLFQRLRALRAPTRPPATRERLPPALAAPSAVPPYRHLPFCQTRAEHF
jgi:hypothetical protein